MQGYTIQLGDKEFEENISFIYEQFIYWKRNWFLLPAGKTCKLYLDETSKLLNVWTDDMPLNRTAIKAIMIMPSLLLQKSKDHLKALKHRMAIRRVSLFRILKSV